MGLTPSVPDIPKSANKTWQIDLGKLIPAAIDADVKAYDLADKDFAARFPGIVAGRQAEIADALQEMKSPNRRAQAGFVDKALESTFGALGGGSEGDNVGLGLGRNSVAASIGSQTQNYQDLQRQNVDRLISLNPERSIGLTSDEALSYQFNNMDALHNAQRERQGLQAQHDQAEASANAAGTSALIGIGTSLLSAL